MRWWLCLSAYVFRTVVVFCRVIL
ncbi:hypothetical protein ISN45_At05g045430 [Arabidopsis thaliana x Arabidopsis arenosa]|uniref:Uncharacterized protein n=2 Tax=Arabidopsis TaxID=3701 RepID=A0A8T2DNH2_ARASU|nr:hypothetical protein ISN45_At05g045430 [Arabidopsis thaliana x Arabidopsis arenosa]KAG7612466.1 hypothetical protein ISN44_As05g044790 [Arabidopsis suecica]